MLSMLNDECFFYLFLVVVNVCFFLGGGGFSCSALHYVFIYLTITSQTLAKHFKLDAPETAGVSYLRHRATRADLICYTFCLRAQYVMTLCAESRLENVFQKW